MPSESPFRGGGEAPPELIETLRWSPQGGLARIERHMARLARSARRLGYPCRDEAVRQALDAACHGTTDLRVRLTLSALGEVRVTTGPAPAAVDGSWRVALSDTPLDPEDPWLGVKSTRRAIYDRAREGLCPGEIDEFLFLNRRGELCEGTITNLFLRHAPGEPLLTPPLACGLLPGILREELLASGEAEEAVLPRKALAEAAEIWLGNALRGLIRAQLVEPRG